MKKYLLPALLATLFTGCNIEKAPASLPVEAQEVDSSEQITPQRPQPLPQVEQITPQRPGTVPVVVDDIYEDAPIIILPPAEAIVGLDADYGFIENSLKINLNSVVHNTTKGDYSTSSGSYVVVKLEIKKNESRNLYVSTKPNCSIRTILSNHPVAGTNSTVDRSDRGYLSHNMPEVGIFTGADPYGITIKNESDGEVLFMYFSIDNDNTNSYFNKESCTLAVAVQ